MRAVGWPGLRVGRGLEDVVNDSAAAAIAAVAAAWATVQCWRATLSYRAAQRAADRKAAKEAGSG